MKKGFTLAEVLITLAVIGIVAAITIPIVVSNYQKKALYTQFMKAYTSLNNAMDLAVVDYGDPAGWNWGHEAEPEHELEAVEGDHPFENYIVPFLKATKTCNNVSDCFAEHYTDLAGEINDDFLEAAYVGEHPVMLSDGIVVGAFGIDHEIAFTFDTNGKKGPNVMGRDCFAVMYDVEEGSFVPDKYKPTGQYQNCSVSNGEFEGCAARLLQEGKMNY